MYNFLAASVALLIFALGAATSIATINALQGWAVSAADAARRGAEVMGTR